MNEKYITIRFYEELNDFLPPENHKKDIYLPFFNQPTIKDIVESFGVPHTEIDLILANGKSVDFNYHINTLDRISVYPKFECFDIQTITKLRKNPLRENRFILDVHLGKLAKYLRLLGFDTLYQNNLEDKYIIRLSNNQERIILTRDVGILKHSAVLHGYYIRSDQPGEQVKEVIQRFDLIDNIQPFSRCLSCNGELKPVEKKDIEHRLDPATNRYYNEFYLCASCEKIFWKGSHYKEMLIFLRNLKSIDF